MVTLFVLQTGLIPFDFSFGFSTGDAFTSTAIENPSLALADIIGNVFLYIPVGFVFHWTLRRIIASPMLAAWLAIVGGAMLSGGIETLQHYSPSRVSSSIDFICNSLGTVVGSVFFLAFQWMAPRAIATIKTELLNHPLSSWLKAYAVLLIIFAMLPFSFSLSPNLIKQSIKSSHLVPFSSVVQDYHQADLALEAGNHRAHAMAKWSALKHWSRWVAEILSFVPFVWLLHFWLVKLYRFKSASASALVWWYAFGLAAGLSFAQIFVIGRGLDTTDLLARLLGIILGVQAIRVTALSDNDDWMAKTRSCWRNIAPAICTMSLFYILYTGVIPLTFGDPMAEAANSLKSANMLPFFGYFETRFDLMMGDILEKMAAYALFGFCLISSCPTLKTKLLSLRLVRACSIALALAMVVELVQLFIPIRVVSLTDPILACVGCIMGVITHDIIHAYLQDVSAKATINSATQHADYADQRELSLTDVLISTLADQQENAPKEVMPRSAHGQSETKR